MADFYDDDGEGQLKAEELRRLRELEGVRNLMRQPEGRAFMWRFLSRCGLYADPAIFGDSDQTFYRCGQQALGHWVLREIIEAAPEHYELMRKENGNAASTATRQDDDD